MPMAFGDPLQWIVIGVVVVAIFLWGPSKIPEIARSVGRARKEFTQGLNETPVSSTEPEAKSPDQTLLDTARRLGIQTEGKTTQQLSDEIVKRVKAFS